jgi:hypothetical protein
MKGVVRAAQVQRVRREQWLHRPASSSSAATPADRRTGAGERPARLTTPVTHRHRVRQRERGSGVGTCGGSGPGLNVNVL